MKILLTTVFLLFFSGLFAQNITNSIQYPFEKWDKIKLEQANTAKDVIYLSRVEKEVIFLSNLARLDGKLFVETYLQFWVDSTEAKVKGTYLQSLKTELINLKSLRVFNPNQDLYNVASKHATNMGKSGQTGHKDFQKRMKPMLEKFISVAENCEYGSFTAIDIVIRLLIDEGISDLGHRKNLLNKNYNSIGVSIKKHKTYRVNCVMDFGSKIEE